MIGLNSSVTSSVVDSKYSASFDGNGDYIDTNNTFSSTFTDSFSISVWIKVDDGQPSATKYICGSSNSSSEDEVFIKITTAGLLSFTTKSEDDTGTEVTDAAVFVDNANDWKHIVCTATKGGSGNTAFAIYVNGSKVDSTNSSVLTVANHANFSTDIQFAIGALNNNGTRQGYFDGAIDEFAIFNTALDSDAVSAIYNGGSPLNLTFDQGNYDNSSALQAYYRMGDGLFDDKANGVVHDQDNPGFEANIWDGTQGDDANWELFGTNTKSEEAGAVKITGDGSNASGVFIRLIDAKDLSEDLVTGKLYSLQFDSKVNSGSSISWRVYKNSGDYYYTTPQNLTSTSFTPLKIIFVAQSTTLDYFYSEGLGSGEIVYIKNISLRKLKGNPGLTSGDTSFSSDTP